MGDNTEKVSEQSNCCGKTLEIWPYLMLSQALWSQWGLSLPPGADLEQKLESFEPQTQFCSLFNFRCPCFISRCRKSSEAGNVNSSQLVLNSKCFYEMEHPSATLFLPEYFPAPLILGSFTQQGTNPPPLCTSELLSPPQAQPISLGQRISLRQIHGTKSVSGAIPLKPLGFYTWERCEAIS